MLKCLFHFLELVRIHQKRFQSRWKVVEHRRVRKRSNDASLAILVSEGRSTSARLIAFERKRYLIDVGDLNFDTWVRCDTSHSKDTAQIIGQGEWHTRSKLLVQFDDHISELGRIVEILCYVFQ